jgi:serine/threonine-protein kinase HipA
MVERISDAVSDTGPMVRTAMQEHPGFREIGKRILKAWAEGISGLRETRVYAMSGWAPGDAFTGFSDPPRSKPPRRIAGRE